MPSDNFEKDKAIQRRQINTEHTNNYAKWLLN